LKINETVIDAGEFIILGQGADEGLPFPQIGLLKDPAML